MPISLSVPAPMNLGRFDLASPRLFVAQAAPGRRR